MARPERFERPTAWFVAGAVGLLSFLIRYRVLFFIIIFQSVR